MIDQELKDFLKTKIEDGEFGTADIPNYFQLFCQLGNELDDMQEEVADWNRSISFEMNGLGIFWMTIEDGLFATGMGAVENPHLVLNADADEAAEIFSGDKDATQAYMSGALRLKGELPDALKLQALIEIVIDEIEY